MNRNSRTFLFTCIFHLRIMSLLLLPAAELTLLEKYMHYLMFSILHVVRCANMHIYFTKFQGYICQFIKTFFCNAVHSFLFPLSSLSKSPYWIKCSSYCSISVYQSSINNSQEVKITYKLFTFEFPLFSLLGL